MFDKPLELLMQRKDHVDDNEAVPKIVRMAANSLYNQSFTARLPKNFVNHTNDDQSNSTKNALNGEERWLGLRVDGIFRESGNTLRIQELKDLFDRDLISSLCRVQFVNNLFDLEDPHVTTNILKLYLRQLPEPVTTFALYEPVVRLVIHINNNNTPTELTKQNKQMFVNEMKQLLSQIPSQNQKLLNAVLFLLHECHLLNDRMKAANLGIVFGGNLFRGQPSANDQSSMDALNQLQYVNRATQWLVEFYYDFFTGEESYLYPIFEPALKQRRDLERCVRELEKESRNPIMAHKANTELITIRNPLCDDPDKKEQTEQKEPRAQTVQKVQREQKEKQEIREQNHLKEQIAKKEYREPEKKKKEEGLQPLKWTVNAGAIDDAVVDFRGIVDEVKDPSLKKKLEDVYARIFYSIYYCDNSSSGTTGGDDDDDEDFQLGPQAYAVMLQEKEDLWLREKKRMTTELETLRNEPNNKLAQTKRALQRLLDDL